MPDERAPASRDVQVAFVTFDCADQHRVADFWQSLLALTDREERGPYVFAQASSGLGFGFQRVEGEKAAKNRVHLDLRSGDVAATRARVRELGGSEPDGYAAGGFLVMADPEGNEFCVLPEGSAALDDEGNAHYEHGEAAL